MNESLEQTLFKLRERVAFLERANGTLSADRHRVMEEFARCEAIIGGLGGRSLSGALAVRLGRIERRESKARNRRHERLAEQFPRDTGILPEDF